MLEVKFTVILFFKKVNINSNKSVKLTRWKDISKSDLHFLEIYLSKLGRYQQQLISFITLL